MSDLPLPDAAAAPVSPPAEGDPALEPATVTLSTPSVPDLPPAACAARLAELFPAVFTAGAPKPLKLRIQADIQQRAPGIFTKKSLSIFLHRHTTSTAYLRALVASPQRADLDGQPAGDVAEEHRQAATVELERRRALHEERRATERAAQRKMHEARRAAEHDAQRKPQEGSPQPRAPGQPDRPNPPHTLRHAHPSDRAHRPAQRKPNAAPQTSPQARRDATPSMTDDAPHRSPNKANHERRHSPPRADEPAHKASVDAGGDTRPERTPDDDARRERQLLLRAYETSTLTKANFCVLKRLTEAQLDALLAQARQDPAGRETVPRQPGGLARPGGPGRPGAAPTPAGPLQRRGPRR